MDRIQIKRNAPVAQLYEDAIRNEGAIISSSGALINFSGKKTGRSPKDKRIVYEETSRDNIWWGSVNIKMDERQSAPLCRFLFPFSYPAPPQTPLKSTASVPLITSTLVTTSTSSMVMPESVSIITSQQHRSVSSLCFASGIPSTASRSASSAPEPTMPFSWYVMFHPDVMVVVDLYLRLAQHAHPSD